MNVGRAEEGGEDTCGHSTSDQTPAALQAELQTLLSDLASNYESYRDAVAALNALLPRGDKLSRSEYPLELVEAAVKGWIERHCEIATYRARAGGQHGHVEITSRALGIPLSGEVFARLEDGCQRIIKLPSGVRPSDGKAPELAEVMASRFPCDLLAEKLQEAVEQFAQTSRDDAASTLGDLFGLTTRTYGRGAVPQEQSFKQVSGRVVVPVYMYGRDRHDRVSKLAKTRQAARVFEREALDTSGGALATACDRAIEAEELLPRSYDMQVASRTRVNREGSVSITFFKDKMQFAFTPTVFEALVGFIGSNGGAPLNPIKLM